MRGDARLHDRRLPRVAGAYRCTPHPAPVGRSRSGTAVHHRGYRVGPASAIGSLCFSASCGPPGRTSASSSTSLTTTTRPWSRTRVATRRSPGTFGRPGPSGERRRPSAGSGGHPRHARPVQRRIHHHRRGAVEAQGIGSCERTRPGTSTWPLGRRRRTSPDRHGVRSPPGPLMHGRAAPETGVAMLRSPPRRAFQRRWRAQSLRRRRCRGSSATASR